MRQGDLYYAALTGGGGIAPALSFWFAACLIAFGIGVTTDGGWQIPFLIGSAGAAMLMWRYQPWPDQWSRYLSFGAVLLLACVANRFLYLLDFLVSGERITGWPIYSAEPEWAVFKGEAITLMGTFVTVLVWFAAGGARISPAVILKSTGGGWTATTILIYIISLAALIFSQLSPIFTAELGQLLPTLLAVGATCAFFLPMVSVESKPKRIVVVFVLSMPFLYAALVQGMKEQIIFSLLPTAYLIWILIRSIVVKAGLVVGAVVAAGLITSFVSYYRTEVWFGQQRTLSQVQAMSEFAGQLESEGVANTTLEGLKGFIFRGNATVHRGWTVTLADEYNREPELVFGPMVYVFIPRIVWPEKPDIRQGWEFSGRIFGADYISSSDSSTAAGFYTSLYLGYGWLAVLGGSAAIGFMMAVLLRLARRAGGDMLAGLFSFAMIPFALRLDEIWAVGALSGPIIGFVYLCLIFLMARIITPVFAATKKGQTIGAVSPRPGAGPW